MHARYWPLAAAGCGRFFEGDAEQMLANMDRLQQLLPPQTAMYSGHEYTVSNLKVRQSPAERAEHTWDGTER